MQDSTYNSSSGAGVYALYDLRDTERYSVTRYKSRDYTRGQLRSFVEQNRLGPHKTATWKNAALSRLSIASIVRPQLHRLIAVIFHNVYNILRGVCQPCANRLSAGDVA